MPLNNACMDIAMSVEVAGPSDGYDIRTRMRHVPGADPETAPVGRIEAVSASTGRTLWSYQQRAPIYGSALATGGNLVFAGDLARRFRAFDAETGAVLWQTILNGPVGGRPMTYSVGGRQYPLRHRRGRSGHRLPVPQPHAGADDAERRQHAVRLRAAGVERMIRLTRSHAVGGLADEGGDHEPEGRSAMRPGLATLAAASVAARDRAGSGAPFFLGGIRRGQAGRTDRAGHQD